MVEIDVCFTKYKTYASPRMVHGIQTLNASEPRSSLVFPESIREKVSLVLLCLNTFEILVNTSFANEKAGCQLSILADKHTQLACDILGMFLSYLFLSLASIYDK